MANSSFFGTSGTTASVTNTIQTSVDAAAASATASATSATASDTAKSASQTAQAASEAARDLALSYRDTALTHKTGAQTAQTAAETAKTGSETARTASQTAQTASEAARDLAASHRDDAQKLALHAEDSQFQLADNSYGYSALHYNAKAQTAKTAAEAALTSFQGQYSTGTTDPTSGLNTGDIFYNSSAGATGGFKVYTGSAWQLTTPASSDQTNINTVAGQISPTNNISSVAGISSAITGVNAISSAVSAVNSNATNINAVNSNATNINAVAGGQTNINTVAGQISPTNNIATVAGVSTAIGNLGPVSANITTVANNLSGVNSFAERYRVGSSDPSSNNDAGDLFYNTASSALKVYNASTSAWEQGVTAGSGFMPTTGGGLTGNLTLNNANLIFEGSTADANETSLTATDPTADRTITLPDKTGTVVTVASDGSTGQLLRTDGSGNYSFVTVQTNLSGDSNPTLSGNLDVGTHDIISSSNNDISLLPNGTGKVIADGNGSSGGISLTDGLIEMRAGGGSVAQIDMYCEVSNAHKVSIKAPAHANYSGNVNFTLPAGNGSNGQFLQTDGSGNLSYATVAQPSNATTGSAGLMSAADKTKIDAIEASADVTDTANVTSAGALMTTGGTMTNHVFFGDGIKGIFGSSNDMEVVHTGGTSLINDQGTGVLELRTNGTDIRLTGNSGSDFMVQAISNGATKLFHDGTEKIATKADGVEIQGELECDTLDVDGTSDFLGKATFHNDISMLDNDKLSLGTSDDLQLYSDGTHSYIQENFSGGNLYIQASNLRLGNSAGTELYMLANENDGALLYFDNSQKFSTIATGCQVSGNLFASDAIGRDSNDYLYWTNNTRIDFVINGSNEFRMESDGDFHADGNIIGYSSTVSDPRLKENVAPVTDALDKVEQLTGYTFTYKPDGVASAGVMSTDVQSVLPSAVKQTALPLKTGEQTKYDVVQYDQLHALLIEAVKELSQRVRDLENGSSV